MTPQTLFRDDPRLWEKQQPAILAPYGPEAEGYYPFRHGSDHPSEWMSPDFVVMNAGFLVVYPDGRTLSLADVNWFWEFEEELRQGTARQAFYYARKIGVHPGRVFAVAPDRVHGTYVRYGEGRKYELVYARPFPFWRTG